MTDTIQREKSVAYEVHFGYDCVGSYGNLREAREHYGKLTPDAWDGVFIIKVETEILTLETSTTIQSK